MINAPYEKEFVFHNGQRAKNILELRQILNYMSQDEVSYYDNDHKNDFSNWIEHVLLDKQLAERIRPVRDKNSVISLLSNKIDEHAAQESLVSLSRKEIIVTTQPAQKQLEVVHAEKKHHEQAHHDTAAHHNILHNPEAHMHEHHPGQHNTEQIHKEQDHKEQSHAESHHTEQHAAGAHEAKKDEKSRAKNKWYEFLMRRNRSAHLHPQAESYTAQEKMFKPEKEIEKNLKEQYSEQTFWIALYGVLIVLIVALLVYKFVFM